MSQITSTQTQTRRWALVPIGLAVLALTLISSACSSAVKQPAAGGSQSSGSNVNTGAQPLSVAQSAQQAYIYGYPLVTMEVTKQVMTNVAAPDAAALMAPVGQFANASQIPTAAYKAEVSPNVDTLDSTAWLDLSSGPIVLHVPDTHGRYYLMSVLDAWTNVIASLGSRTTGTGAGDFAITGPGWTGSVPVGVHWISSPTNLVWIIGRTQVNGPADVAAVHAIQQGYRLTPLSAWGKLYTPPQGTIDPAVHMGVPAAEQIAHMNAVTYFATLAAAMKANPPYPADRQMVAQIKQLGIVPGQPFDFAALPLPTQQALQQATQQAVPLTLQQNRMTASGASSSAAMRVHGWNYSSRAGQYGTDYLFRAAVAQSGLGANLDADALYTYAETDAASEPLSGANRYVLHFAPGQTPPVNGFWSLTMYGADHFLVATPLNRYAVGHGDALRYNPDGSLDISIQQQSPGPSKESNWLPAPGGDFTLALRMYWPKPAALNRSWTPPAVVQLH